MCCSVLQCVAVCCCHILDQGVEYMADLKQICCSVLQCVAVCCSVMQCVAVCCSVLQCAAVCCSVLQSISDQGAEDMADLQVFVGSFRL